MTPEKKIELGEDGEQYVFSAGSNKELLTVHEFLSLRDMNLQIRKGSFICIIGDVGSGKSSLLSSLIGDLLYLP